MDKSVFKNPKLTCNIALSTVATTTNLSIWHPAFIQLLNVTTQLLCCVVCELTLLFNLKCLNACYSLLYESSSHISFENPPA